MKNDLEQRYINMIQDNVNVGKTNVGIEFISLVAGLVALCFLIYLCADGISNLLIDKISVDTQLKIEKTISITSSKPYKLNEEINAFVYPDGSIYVTKGLLDKINDNEMLTFIIAHELGHYVHRDHLKMISRQIIVYTINSIISGGSQTTDTTIGNISSLNELKHSRNQERNADKYANKMVYRIYGNNNGAIRFFQYLEKEEKAPEFIQYFSTHPSTKQRLKLIQNK